MDEIKKTITAPERIRPKDAATLIIYRTDNDAVRLLMGRRSMKHVFMPGALVFPGGRVEGQDSYAPSADGLDPAVEAMLLRRAKITPTRARALAMAAIRETFEETGILLGFERSSQKKPSSTAWQDFVSHGVQPALSRLQFHMRAITPPGSPRRFDARFFVVEADAIAKQAPVMDNELEAPSWVTLEEARNSAHLATVTRMVLDSLETKLASGRLVGLPELIRWSPKGELAIEPL